jgi:hypothetical protein
MDWIDLGQDSVVAGGKELSVSVKFGELRD